MRYRILNVDQLINRVHPLRILIFGIASGLKVWVISTTMSDCIFPSGPTRRAVFATKGSGGAAEASALYDVEQPLEMLRAGDVNGGLRELRAYVDANPGNRAARQKIGAAVADRARELQSKGSREQSYLLYEQAVALRGEATPEWTTQMQVLRKALSDEYYSNGERAYRTDVALAIAQWETSLRYDPQNLKASTRLRDARAAQEKLKAMAPAK